jgi:hypothetical protein
MAAKVDLSKTFSKGSQFPIKPITGREEIHFSTKPYFSPTALSTEAASGGLSPTP